MTRRLGPWLGLIALCLALYVPGLTALPPVDRDEARFAQATKQMMESGDYVRIRYQDEARNKKPAGIYWAQAASASLLGGTAAPIWAYRLPSLAALTAAVLLLYAAGRRLFEPRTAFLAASLLAASLLAVVEAHLAKTDAGLLATTVAAQGALGLIYLRGRAGVPAGWLLPLGFWIALALGILIKGPVLPLVGALTIAALGVADRSLAWLKGARPALGILVAAAIVAPWGLAITQATDGAFLADAVGKDLLPKLIGGQESHGAPPGYHVLLLAVGFFPASLQVAPALRAAWRQRLLPAERFCLAWLVPAWLVFELVPTKLPHYVLPLYPALALLTARFVIGLASSEPATPPRWVRALLALWFAVALTIVGAALALPLVVDQRIDWIALVPALASALAAGAALIYAWQGRPLKSTVIAVAGAGVLFATVFGTVLPRVDGLWLSRAATEMVLAHRPAARAPVVAAGYAEPSLVFLLGTPTLLTGGGAAAAFLAEHVDALALVAADQDAAFRTQAAALGLGLQELDRRIGYNYSRGRWTALALYRRAR
ncbi:MAG: glycosyltransferase family 39 protein [Proteobacteria bacterium]|nr:glycosyltransferase family 39 protein [Pseudomonadota bacterium]